MKTLIREKLRGNGHKLARFYFLFAEKDIKYNVRLDT